MIDANFKFNPMEARLLCRAIEDYNLFWFEEPLYQNDVCKSAQAGEQYRENPEQIRSGL
jgi:L-alanine-DL-glutamate epimerase-like enolase superfamily enzyme